MSSSVASRLFRALLSVTMIVGVIAGTQVSASAGPNLLPNASFEESVFEPAPVPQYTQPQPLLPTGWAVEGVAGLFDHSPNGRHSGRRMAAISIPASGNRRQCADGNCVDNPANAAKDAGILVASAAPAWRNAVPVAVNGGQSYTLSAWVSGEIITEGEGAFTAVRWLDSLGVPISVSYGPKRLAEQFSQLTAWAQISATVVAPSNARQAIVLFGHTDDAWIGQIRFDDVFFG